MHVNGQLWYLILNEDAGNRNLNVNRDHPDDNWNANYRAAAVAICFVVSLGMQPEKENRSRSQPFDFAQGRARAVLRFAQHFLSVILHNMYWVYVIRSLRKGSLYFGLTSDLHKRLLQHNADKNTSTRFGVPWEYVYCEGYKSVKDARLREAKLKHYGNSRTHIKKRLKHSLL